jgi:hypothetical protein
MEKIIISINPMAEFLEATESRKKKIIEEQLDPDPVRVPYYQLSRARISLSILNNVDFNIIDDAIQTIKERNPKEKTWQFYDKTNSIASLNLFKELLLPNEILDLNLEKVKTKSKYLSIYNVHIKISPNLIFRTIIDGQKVIGAVKLHLSKGKPFSNKQSALVAQLLNQFLCNEVAEEDEIVVPNLCLCIDPFAGTTINAMSKIKLDMKEIKLVCEQIPKLWDQANNDRNSNAA